MAATTVKTTSTIPVQKIVPGPPKDGLIGAASTTSHELKSVGVRITATRTTVVQATRVIGPQTARHGLGVSACVGASVSVVASADLGASASMGASACAGASGGTVSLRCPIAWMIGISTKVVPPAKTATSDADVSAYAKSWNTSPKMFMTMAKVARDRSLFLCSSVHVSLINFCPALRKPAIRTSQTPQPILKSSPGAGHENSFVQ
mmetsp:Transcript_33337/g.55136  ORF Transcript_33337/g.55136 Transcript_33337/m.55136 type:complete len:206 (+) Transcript_33337:1409-2026(+)